MPGFIRVQEEHLEQMKLARSKASNLLVPDDYDGSTYHAKLTRDQAKVNRSRHSRDILTKSFFPDGFGLDYR